MGCMALNGSVPQDQKVFTVDGSNLTCANHTGAIGGGADSSSYFEQPNPRGDVPMIFAAVVDADGTTVYRWPAEQEDVWPGLHKLYADDRLGATRPTRMRLTTPCNTTEPCGIHQPSCGGECPLIEAGGVFGEYTAAGNSGAEAAKDGQNWWDLFKSTGQLDARMDASKLPYSTPVPHFTPRLKFYCNQSCGDLCLNESCSVNATYMCTAGDGFGGCSADPTVWPTSGKCGACCNTTSCYFECAPCSDEEAATLCPQCDDPYVCTKGQARGGCGNASTWGRSPRACQACCVCPPRAQSPVENSFSYPATWGFTPPLWAIGCIIVLAAMGACSALGRRDMPRHKDAVFQP